MNPELDNDNLDEAAPIDIGDNLTVATEETDVSTGEVTDGTDGSSDGEDGSGSFWSGNPLALAPENLAVYREMQSAEAVHPKSTRWRWLWCAT